MQTPHGSDDRGQCGRRRTEGSRQERCRPDAEHRPENKNKPGKGKGQWCTTNKVAEMDWGMIWTGARERLRRELGEAVFDAWIAPLALVNAANGEVKIGACKPFARNWVSNHYVARIERALKAEGARAHLVVDRADGAQAGDRRRACARSAAAPIRACLLSACAGDERREARRARAQSVEPRAACRPELRDLHLRPGQRVCLSRRARDGRERRWRHHPALPAWQFRLRQNASSECHRTRSAHAAAAAPCFWAPRISCASSWARSAARTRLAFKDELRAADMLLIDDLQHICRTNSTISEFLHTVNAFTAVGRKLVIAADRPPQALEALGDDVRSRLSGGLVIPVEKPDRATRLPSCRPAPMRRRASARMRHCRTTCSNASPISTMRARAT